MLVLKKSSKLNISLGIAILSLFAVNYAFDGLVGAIVETLLTIVFIVLALTLLDVCLQKKQKELLAELTASETQAEALLQKVQRVQKDLARIQTHLEQIQSNALHR